MARGGRRTPKESNYTSGIGKNSRRTDGQPMRTPNVQDSTDLQVGDRERIRQAQKVQPLSDTPSPRVAAPPRGGSATPAVGGGAVLPPHLFEMPTSRPDEDVLTPASEAPIEPEDDQEVVLQWLVDAFGDDAADKMLRDKRAAKVASEVPMAIPTAEPEMAPPMQEIEPEPQPLGEEDVEVEEPLV